MLTACPKETVLKLSYNFVKRKINRNNVLYKQQDKADAIYLVKSGIIQLCTTIEKPSEVKDVEEKYKMLD